MGYICNGLQSVLHCEGALQIHHQSFADFLLDPNECSQDFLIVRKRENRNLAVARLKAMKGHLRFNICELESSYLQNSEVYDLLSRIEKHIPLHLFLIVVSGPLKPHSTTNYLNTFSTSCDINFYSG